MQRNAVLFTRLSLSAACVSAPVAAQQRLAPIRIENAALTLSLDGRDGHVLALLDRGTGQQFIGHSPDSTGLWLLHVAGAAGGETITPARARRFRATPGPRGTPTELVWEDFGLPSAPGLRVTVSVRTQGDTANTEWRIRLDGISGLAVDSVRFPRLTGIQSLGDREELAVPVWMGQRTRDPRRLLAGPDGGGKRFEWFYPGQLSFQMVTLYQNGGAGLYAAADDSLAYRKSFAVWGERGGTAGYELVHLPENPGHNASYSPSYAAIIGTFAGDWLTAVERYREWGTRQRWARESRLTNDKVPQWVQKTGIWVWNRGRSPDVLVPAAALQKQAGLPVSVFWHWWHKGAYDTSFPDYLPPREGAEPFRAAVQQAHREGLHAIVYMNQRLWCLDTPSWKAEHAERAAVRNADGTIRTEVYNIFNPLPCATMDVTTAQWRAKYSGIAQQVVRDYGLDGIYMDQAVLSLVCYSPDHGHPVGGGHYWMDGFTRLASDVRERASSDPIALGGEGGGETWLPQLDIFLTLQVSMERYGDPASGWEVLPLFQSVYHAYGITYGSYSSLAYPPYDDLWPAASKPPDALQPLDRKYRRQFYLEQARSFVWGMQPTIANFLTWQLTDRPEEIAYLTRLARLRDQVPEFLLRGTFLRPPSIDAADVDVTISRVSIYASRNGGATETTKRSPAAITGAWRSPSGVVAMTVASIIDTPQTIHLGFDPSRYGLRGGGTAYRRDAAGRTLIGTFAPGPSSLPLTLAPLGAAVIELVPR